MRVFRFRMSTLVLIGLLLVTVVSRSVNCESSVVDDEDDDDEPVDEMETSGSAVGVHSGGGGGGGGGSDNSASADTFERPPNVNTYRDDQSSRNSNNNEAHQQQHPPAQQSHNSYETTAAESNQSGNQIYADSDDVETDSETFDDNMDSNEFGDNDERDGDGDSSSSSQSQSQPAQPSAPLNGQQQSPTLFTYQNNRSKLLNIIKKPGILAGIVGGAIIGILTAILLIMFIVYRMRKKDEGSYALEETKKPLNAYDYRHCPTKEFYA